MESQQSISKQTSHSGGDTRFWQNERVQKYEYQQSLLSEKKEDILANIARIVNYFCMFYSIASPKVLDIGCGPGTPMTLSTYILEEVVNSTVVGVDSSGQMIEAANGNLHQKYGQRFSAVVSDFNTDTFWIPEIEDNYDFIVSNGTLHYLSDRRRNTFFREIYNHVKDKGTFVGCWGNRSQITGIAEMEHLFRVEFTYNQLNGEKQPQDFREFKERFDETDKKANINWLSQGVWLDVMQSAGFKGVDVVWHLWVRSIFVAVK